MELWVRNQFLFTQNHIFPIDLKRMVIWTVFSDQIAVSTTLWSWDPLLFLQGSSVACSGFSSRDRFVWDGLSSSSIPTTVEAFWGKFGASLFSLSSIFWKMFGISETLYHWGGGSSECLRTDSRRCRTSLEAQAQKKHSSTDVFLEVTSGASKSLVGRAWTSPNVQLAAKWLETSGMPVLSSVLSEHQQPRALYYKILVLENHLIVYYLIHCVL